MISLVFALLGSWIFQSNGLLDFSTRVSNRIEELAKEDRDMASTADARAAELNGLMKLNTTLETLAALCATAAASFQFQVVVQLQSQSRAIARMQDLKELSLQGRFAGAGALYAPPRRSPPFPCGTAGVLKWPTPSRVAQRITANSGYRIELSPTSEFRWSFYNPSVLPL